MSAAVHPRLDGGSRLKLATGSVIVMILALSLSGYLFYSNSNYMRALETWRSVHASAAGEPVPDLKKIIRRSATILNVDVDDKGAHQIALRSRGTPRVANRLLRRVRDYADVIGEGKITQDEATKALDKIISEHAPEWPLEQVAIIDRNILRIALWEIAVYRNTPVKVAINEAVELAKIYGSDSTPRFVNGVLGSLANRQNEIQQSLRRISERS